MSKNIAKLNLFPLPHTRPPLFSKRPLDKDINNDTIIIVTEIEDILAQMRKNPKGIRFNDLCRVCNFYFGKARQGGSSHRVYKIPWQGDPRVNIQNDRGKAKAYQVKQVLRAIEKLEVNYGTEK
jgi:hypothetical protein